MRKLIYLTITWSGYILREFLGSFYFFITKKLFKKCGESIFFTGIPYITGINNVELGDNIVFGDNLVIRGEGGLFIGSNVIVAANLTIYTYNHNYESTLLPFDYTDNLKKVVIEDNVWIGRNVSIVPGITIGEGAVIGMGSVVTRNIPPLAIVGGNPATIIKYRDNEQYNLLKTNKNFYEVKSLFYYIKKLLNGLKN